MTSLIVRLVRAASVPAWFWSLCLLLDAHSASADIRLPSIFSDHMVLQAEVAVPVWGWANPNETVRVSIAGQTKQIQADSQGHWRVTLEPLPTGTRTSLVVQGTQRLTVHDVLIGEVWLFAGDALMAKTIDEERRTQRERSEKLLPAVRCFKLRTTAATEPQQDVPGEWVVLEQANLGDFPAVPYLFAKAMHARKDSPCGLIQAIDPSPVSIQRGGRVTGSTIEAWMSEGRLRAMAAAKPILDYHESPLELREALAEYEKALGDWKLQTGKAFGDELRELERREPDVWFDYVEEMRKAGRPAPTNPPRRPTVESLRMATTRATNLYHGMIAPIAGYALRGVAISIGMANSPRASQYRELFPAWIQDWRTAWKREDLPFIFLQQSRARHPNIDPRALCELREAQAAAARIPHAAMVRCLDLGGNIFPEDLPSLAQRMVESAEMATHYQPAKARGVEIAEVELRDGRAIVRFHAGTVGLSVNGGGALRGFSLAERPNRWAYADAKIDGDKVIVSHPKLKAPIAVRYDWVHEPGYEGNLTDASGLPALPYRSDDWPAFTATPAAMKPNALATLLLPDLYPVVDPSLPRVLLIGDSIKNGYAPFVKSILDGKVNVTHLVAFGMIGKKDADAQAFCSQLKDGDYALIHYNDGLHSLPPRITDEQFGVGLTAMLKHLKTITPHVIWATTTPAPDRDNTLGPASQNPTVIARNAMSKEIAAKFHVPVNDLYEIVVDKREKLQKFANLHFTPEGSQLMAEQTAAMIREALQIK
jgi:sialate O-acetylesterase